MATAPGHRVGYLPGGVTVLFRLSRLKATTAVTPAGQGPDQQPRQECPGSPAGGAAVKRFPCGSLRCDGGDPGEGSVVAAALPARRIRPVGR